MLTPSVDINLKDGADTYRKATFWKILTLRGVGGGIVLLASEPLENLYKVYLPIRNHNCIHGVARGWGACRVNESTFGKRTPL